MKKLIILGLAAALALPSFAQAEKKVDIASIKADSVTVLKPYRQKITGSSVYMPVRTSHLAKILVLTRVRCLDRVSDFQ